MRNAVLSDTGGWLPQLLQTLVYLGVDMDTGKMPEDLRVIHCGDLLHKGPFSSELLNVVTTLMVLNPGQWVQLMGNHEAQHIPGSPVFWPCECTPQDIGLLNAWLAEGLMKPAFGLHDAAQQVTPAGIPLESRPTDLFFSHGGLTAGFWEWKTGAVTDVVETARIMNEMPIQEVTAPGLLLGNNVPPRSVGPVWAIGNTEVFKSWRDFGQAMPFGQFHGHTTSYSFDWKKWWPNLQEFKSEAVLLPKHRAVAREVAGNLLLGVDPGFNERQPRIPFQTWFEFETLT